MAVPSARARSVRARRLLRLLGALPVPELVAASRAIRELEDRGSAGPESVTSLAMLIAETCVYQAMLAVAAMVPVLTPYGVYDRTEPAAAVCDALSVFEMTC